MRVRLTAALKDSLSVMKMAVREQMKGEKSVFDGWLTDNYFLLERIGKQVLYKSKRIHKSKNSDIAKLFEKCMKICKNGILPSEETIIDAFKNAKIYDAARLHFAITAALIVYAGNGVRLANRKGTEILANAVKSLRNLEEFDFEYISQSILVCEELFQRDPAEIYGIMDDYSKHEYRKAVVIKAEKIGKNEIKTAGEALMSAQKSGRHIGEYLVSTSKNKACGIACLISEYLMPLISAVAAGILLSSFWSGFMLFFVLYPIFKNPVERAFLAGIKPKRFMRLKSDSEAVKNVKALITVSVLMPPPDRIKSLEKHLEKVYLSNCSGNIKVCCLADFKGADMPTKSEDKVVLKALRDMTDRLNNQHGGGFVIAVRPRIYSKTQSEFIGKERKRGAITDLIRAIKGDEKGFIAIHGDKSDFNKAEYIIVLDADTEIEFDGVNELIAIAEHPLNRPYINKEKGRVTSGYGILVPEAVTRINPSNSRFADIMAGESGLSSYNSLTNEKYQDLFGEGVFCGKGLIDVESYYELMLKGLPEETILSHDIIEGGYLRAGYVSDVHITESFPQNTGSYFKRLHRWVRGDWQNISFIFTKNPLNRLSRYKLWDNLVRSLQPVISLLILFASMFIGERIGAAIAIAALFSVCAPDVFSGISSATNGGLSVFTRRFYSDTVPEAFRYFLRAAASVALWTKQSVITVSAVFKALWRRFVSKKKLLEWATAADADKEKSVFNMLISCVPSVAASVILFVFGGPLHRLAALLMLGDIPLTLIFGVSQKSKKHKISKKSEESLLEYAASMWRFFDEQCTKEHNFLPPDNIQLSPSRAVASRTSPTNIGLMLVSFLAARDFGFITSEELCKRLDLSLKTVEKLEKYEGNLFNWYSTETCEIIGEKFISTVDSGNFLCSLVTLKEGVREYAKEYYPLNDIAERSEKLIKETNLSIFYNKNRKLFHIGLFSENGRLSESFYDLYMSEMRATAYFAVAKRLVPRQHWSSPARTVVKSGNFYGLASWTGTMFEYFMPNLFIPSKKGSLDYESLNFCLYCQRKRAGKRPFGISESGFYAFDAQLNYQYKAHGVQKLGLKRNLNKEYVVSPYSSFLTLSFAPEASVRNLGRLKEMGMTGDYGFFEATDFTSGRCAGEKYRIVRSYMAHHVGMSMLSVANLLKNNCMQRRFMRDKEMHGAESLLNEKIPQGTAVFKDIYDKKVPAFRERTQKKTEISDNPCVFSPQATVLSNGRMSVCLSDAGTGQTIFDGINVTVEERDILSRPQGVFAVFVDDDGVKPFVSVLDKEGTGRYRAKFNNNSVEHEAKHGFFILKMQTTLNRHSNCEMRRFTIENTGKKSEIKGKLLVYLEPCLDKKRDFAAHPAFSRLFIMDEWNGENEYAVFYRNGAENNKLCAVTVGFINKSPDAHEFSRESVLQTPLGVFSLGIKTDFKGGIGNPDCCCAFSFDVSIKSGQKEAFELAVAVAESREESINTFLAVKAEKGKSKKASISLGTDSLDIAVAKKVLPEIMYGGYSANYVREEIKPLKKDNLWSFGISGDNPIILIKLETQEDAAAAVPYIRANKNLRSCGIESDLVLAYDKPDGYFGEIRSELRRILSDENSELMLGVKGGIFLINYNNFSYEKQKFLENSAAVIFKPESQTVFADKIRFKPLKTVAFGKSLKDENYTNIVKQINFTNKQISLTKKPVTVDIPWNLVLANKSFGTMVSDKSLGFTWALNSRENKLTPWYNDSLSDNRGELLIMKYNGVLYDLISLSNAVFTPSKAEWKLECCGLIFKFEVTVADRGMVKKCRVEITNKSDSPKELDIAYYLLPVLGVSRENSAGYSVKRTVSGAVIGSVSGEIPGVMTLQCDGKADYICFSQHDFWEGRFNSEEIGRGDFCVSTGRKVSLAVGGSTSFNFYVSWGACEKAALKMPYISSFGGKSSSLLKVPADYGTLALFCNSFLYPQVKNSRFYARTGFYQCSGAYGFRDQLQDCLALVFNNPDLVRTHIIRCCAVQFEEGDVLHWWHVLVDKTQKIRGVRTRCSDDMLWLPYICSDYINKTGDKSILNIRSPYIEGEKLRKGEKERYFSPLRTQRKGTVFEHCIRAIEKSLNFGPNGLPLIGSCDWNDGFNNIGDEETGESVWLAMFQIVVLKEFAPICRIMGQNELSEKYLNIANKLEKTVDNVAWAGEHYARAIMKDGSFLGGNDFIDILPQAFAAFAEFRNKNRVETALTTAYKTLFDEKNGVIRLFNKPFSPDECEKVGYIANYPEGIRENSGQSTHAAVWLARAMFKIGEKEKGEKLLNAINPISFYSDEKRALIYRAEPFVLSGDVSYRDNMVGRAGWTHFTGSAAWIYKCVFEDLLEYEMSEGLVKNQSGIIVCKEKTLNTKQKRTDL